MISLTVARGGTRKMSFHVFVIYGLIMASNHCGMVSVYLTDNNNTDWEQLMSSMVSTDYPAKLVASLGALYFCDDSEIHFSVEDYNWYHENRPLIENAIANVLNGSSSIQVMWIFTDSHPQGFISNQWTIRGRTRSISS